ncbi:MAG: hypothetical protein EU549_04125 [Promethearchaeota archaeon]|nr:MAG: hypothetical protein EU549_04125 [Candidatus Lokiarchaeota archaeon]
MKEKNKELNDIIKKLYIKKRSRDEWKRIIEENREEFQNLKDSIRKKQRELKDLVIKKRIGEISQSEFETKLENLQEILTRLETKLYKLRLKDPKR